MDFNLDELWMSFVIGATGNIFIIFLRPGKLKIYNLSFFARYHIYNVGNIIPG